MSEERKEPLSPTPEDSAPEGNAITAGQQKRRQRSVFQYIAIMFAAAFLLLLFTFVMEKRQYEQLQQENQEQIDNLQQSVTAVQSLQNLYDQNAALKDQVAELKDEVERLEQEKKQANATLRQQMDKLADTAAAMDWFWQIDEAYVRGRTSLCRSLIQNLEAAGLESSLPTQSITDTDRFSPYHRYLEIKEALG